MSRAAAPARSGRYQSVPSFDRSAANVSTTVRSAGSTRPGRTPRPRWSGSPGNVSSRAGKGMSGITRVSPWGWTDVLEPGPGDHQYRSDGGVECDETGRIARGDPAPAV